MVGCVGLGSTCLGQRAANPIKPTLSDEDKQALADLDAKLKKDFGVLRNNAELKLDGKDESDLKAILAGQEKLKKDLKKKEELFKDKLVKEKDRQQMVNDILNETKRLNLQLAQGGLTVQQNNSLVAQASVLDAQKEQIENSQKQFDEELKKIRLAFRKAEEKYRGNILDARKKADAIEVRWTKLEGDKAFKKLVKEASDSWGKAVEQSPFNMMKSKLKGLEKGVLSDVIPLRNDDGSKVFSLSVTISGEQTVEMMLDTGASMISLPASTAKELGVEVPPNAPDVVLKLANNTTIMAKLITIPLVRVGSFEVENVQAVVLNTSGQDAVALLGMSFLENFNYKVDNDEKTLTLLKVDIETKKR
jgi:aspartyl protease family protein